MQQICTYEIYTELKLMYQITIFTASKCILDYSMFHQIFNEFEHFYHGEIDQRPNEQGSIVKTMNWSTNTQWNKVTFK